MRVWITRTQPGADATAARVKALGHDPLVSPVLQVEPLAATLDMTGVGALAFTSAHAVDAFAGLEPRRDWPAFTVGRATAAAARRCGFSAVISADADGAALAKLILAAHHVEDGAVLHAAALEPAVDLAASLAASGIPVRVTPVYRTVPAAPAPELAAALSGRAAPLDAVLIQSAKAASQAVQVLQAHPAVRLSAYAMSGAAAAPLADTRLLGLYVAAQPTQAALLDLLDAPLRDATDEHV